MSQVNGNQTITHLCVYCGASPGAHPEYMAAGRRLGAMLAEKGITLVYGGAHIGVMGAVADAVIENGGNVIGVIPGFLALKEVMHTGLTELIVVESMHERKAKMLELSNGFMALPGGYGTMEELFEVITWAQLGLHGKPIGVLNVNGYYNPLLALADHMLTEGFVRPSHRQMLLSHSEPEKLLALLEVWHGLPVDDMVVRPVKM